MAKPKLKPIPDEKTANTGDEWSGVVVHDDGEFPAHPDLVRIVQLGWQAKIEMENAKKRLEEVNEDLIAILAAPGAIVIPGLCRATYVKRQTVKIADIEKLETLLGDRLLDLVDETVSYRASDKLVSMAADADDPLSPSLRALLKVAESDAVTFRAEK